MRATAGGDQIEAMFGSFSLSLKGYALIALIAGAGRGHHRVRLAHHRFPGICAA